jgi:hypothetical protein
LLTLKTKPVSNIFNFNIATENLDFFYQPELTEEEILDNANRPPEVVGSYAVYHSSKANNEYKAGKAFHIYRPKVWDSAGKTIWGVLNVDTKSGILSIAVDQKFIDTAVYPVFVDPTFGYETTGKSTVGLSNQIRGTLFTCPESGTATSVAFYLDNNGGNTSKTYKFAIYLISDSTLVASTEEGTIGAYTGPVECSLNISASLSNVDYAVCWWSSGTITCYYDAGTNLSRRQALTYGAWPSPATFITNSYQHTSHVHYDAAATAYYPKLSLCGVGR